MANAVWLDGVRLAKCLSCGTIVLAGWAGGARVVIDIDMMSPQAECEAYLSKVKTWEVSVGHTVSHARYRLPSSVGSGPHRDGTMVMASHPHQGATSKVEDDVPDDVHEYAIDSVTGEITEEGQIELVAEGGGGRFEEPPF